VVDPNSPRLIGLEEATGLDSIVFAATAEDVREVYVGGKQIVGEGVHPGWEEARRVLATPGP
jgi:cytosine/adenosine deaminase-related metal-dependent hydrolase